MPPPSLRDKAVPLPAECVSGLGKDGWPSRGHGNIFLKAMSSEGEAEVPYWSGDEVHPPGQESVDSAPWLCRAQRETSEALKRGDPRGTGSGRQGHPSRTPSLFPPQGGVCTIIQNCRV